MRRIVLAIWFLCLASPAGAAEKAPSSVPPASQQPTAETPVTVTLPLVQWNVILEALDLAIPARTARPVVQAIQQQASEQLQPKK